MKEKFNNKIVLILSIIGLFLIFVGVSFALFNANFIGKKTHEVVIGDNFLFQYSETSNSLTLTDDDVLSDEEGKVSKNYFDFNVKLQSNVSESTNYYIYLTKDIDSSTIDDKYINVYLTDQNDNKIKNVKLYSSLVDNETYSNSKYLYGTSITSSNNTKVIHDYRLRVWIDENYIKRTNQDGVHEITTEEGTYKFTINVSTGESPLEGNLAKTWKDKTANELNYLALYTLNSKTLPETYSYNSETYSLDTTTDVSEQQNNSVLLGEYKSGDNIIAVIGQEGKVIAPVDSTTLFYELTNVTTMDLSNFDTSNVTNMSHMFNSCSSLTELDLSSFNTSKVTDMEYMFYNCYRLKTVIVGCNWVVGETTTTTDMFSSAGVSAVTKVCNE